MKPKMDAATKKSWREAGRRYSALRKRFQKKCPICGTEFTGIATKIYDKPACSKLAYYRRQHPKTKGEGAKG